MPHRGLLPRVPRVSIRAAFAAALLLLAPAAANAGLISQSDLSSQAFVEDFGTYNLPDNAGRSIAAGGAIFTANGPDDAPWRLATYHAGTGPALVSGQPGLDVIIVFAAPPQRVGLDIATSSTSVTKIGFYDVGGTLLNNVYLPSSGNLGIAPAFAGWESVAGIASIRIIAAGPMTAALFDNLRYETIPAPEPAITGLLGLGLAALAFRRRKPSRPLPSGEGRLRDAERGWAASVAPKSPVSSARP